MRATLFFGASLLTALARAATFTVINTADSGAGSLRKAMLDSNASAGVLDTIAFDIPGSGVHTIAVATQLPSITDPVVLDGTTQPGYTGQPLIELTPSVSISIGLRISSGGSIVRGFVIHGFGSLIQFITLGGNHIEACYVGTDATGTADPGGSTSQGIYLQNSDGNTIGGATSATRNLISGSGTGILASSSDNTTIQGNSIGTDVSGSAALGNATGISLANSAGTLIGGTAAGAGNLISGNGSAISVSGSDATSILGNLVGTDVTGAAVLPNVYGINANNCDGLIVGGSAPGAGNLFSGNNTGIFLNNGVTNATVQGNRLGTDGSGTLPLPNTYNMLLNTAQTTDVLIGGVNPGEGNVIAYGANPLNGGIWNFGQRIRVRGNSMHDNRGLGLDNVPVNLNANDPGDADTGGNGLQNFPLLSSVTILAPQGTGTRIQGVLRSAASTTYDLDFYDNGACTNFPRELVEGTTYIGSGEVTTDASGTGVFDVTVPVSVAPDARISATATDPDGNTSEMSQRIVFSMTPAAGPSEGGTNLTIKGTDFDPAATVAIGGVTPGSVTVSNSTTITATSPALPAGTANDVVVTNPDTTAGTLVKGWVSNFLDVPTGHQFHTFVTTLVSNGITAGIGGGLYGAIDNTLRQQMAVFLLKAKYGLCYAPPNCTGVFTDVPCPSTFANWIEALAALGITGGCGPGVYCPQNPVRRDQMAVFLLKAKYGSGYTPPPCTGVFPDVACPSQFADWIEQLAEETITGGCGGGNYCPLNPNTRGQMSVFLVKAFALQ